MTVTLPRDLLAAVAVQVLASTAIRTVVDRAPVEWRTDGSAYCTVTQVSEIAPALVGDGVALADRSSVQVSLWETRAEETPARIAAVVAAVDGVALQGHGMFGRVAGIVRIPDPDTDLIQHAATVRYPLPR